LENGRLMQWAQAKGKTGKGCLALLRGHEKL
jgi:hypothetical protein